MARYGPYGPPSGVTLPSVIVSASTITTGIAARASMDFPLPEGIGWLSRIKYAKSEKLLQLLVV